MKIIYPEGATPLDPDGLKGIIPTHLTNQSQLDEWEYANILEAEKWAYSRRHNAILTPSFLTMLHRKMFCDTWSWAGEFRKSQTNIGVSWHQISTQVHLLCDDFKFHQEAQSFSTDELAVRFHHRLVLIHPFTNGNGRHARIMANLLVRSLGGSNFSWGLKSKSDSLTTSGELRKSYLTALRKADQGIFRDLIEFCRT